MASYANDLRLKEITTGDEDGTWGTSTNTNLSLIADAFSYGTIQLAADANETFTMPDATADGTRSLYLKVTSAGSLTATREVTLGPNTVSKVWIIENATTGSQIITIKQGSGATVNVPNGSKVMVATDGAGAGAAVLNANPTEVGGTVTSVDVSGGTTGLTTSGGPITSSGTITLAGTLAVANGGTGTTSITANNVILGNGTSAVQVVAPGTSGNVLTSDGTTWTSAAPAAGLTGVTDSGTPYTTALGTGAGASITTGGENTAVGYEALNDATSNDAFTAIGYQSLRLAGATGGGYGVAVGSNSGYSITTATYLTAIGQSAAYSLTTGTSTTAIGSGALYSCTVGANNTAVGFNASLSVTGGYNTSVGYNALRSGSTGTYNVAVGWQSCYYNGAGNYNVGVGKNALFNNTGSNNVGIGFEAGYTTTTGANNIIIGANADASSATVSNEITLGDSNITTLRCQVTTITSLSDERDKANIDDLAAGLNFVNALRPVEFDWNMRDGNKVGVRDTGFIAQELQAAQATTGVDIPDLVYAENPDRLEAGYGKLIPVLVKAIQELSAEVEALKAAQE